MYKFVFLIIVLFSIQLKSEEFQSTFGFTIDFPDKYLSLGNLNSEQINQLMQEEGFNTDLLTNLELNSDGEYFVSIKQLVEADIPDEIFIRGFKRNWQPFSANYCEGFHAYLISLIQRDIKQYACKKVEFPPIKYGEAYYTNHEGGYSADERVIQVQFFLNKEFFISFGTNCVIETCNEAEKDMIEMIKSMRMSN